MKLTNISFNPNIRPSFASNARAARDENGKFLHNNTTNFFRIDLEWDKYTDFLIEKYKDQNKVDVYCYACSDGTEPYSLAMMLITKLGFEGAQKFFPIKARDIDDYYFEKLKKGEIAVNNSDLEKIKKKTNGNTLFIVPTKNDFWEGNTQKIISKINPKLKNTVIFQKGDLREDIKTLPKSNCVLMFRNAWSYLKDNEDRAKLLKDIHNQLDETSVFVSGSHDIIRPKEKFEHYLAQNKFKPTGINYCYEIKEATHTYPSQDVEYLKYLHKIEVEAEAEA